MAENMIFEFEAPGGARFFQTFRDAKFKGSRFLGQFDATQIMNARGFTTTAEVVMDFNKQVIVNAALQAYFPLKLPSHI